MIDCILVDFCDRNQKINKEPQFNVLLIIIHVMPILSLYADSRLL